MTNQQLDATATRMYLNELKSQLDNAISQGEVFEKVKKLYMQINLLIEPFHKLSSFVPYGETGK